ncbi:MAG TPA: PAS domain-containing protein, partial [Roseiflexaceae bacterium]|nr:PAS domain-containing protein [Roseiflexaceae bacterium]
MSSGTYMMQSEDRFRFLAEAGELLSASLDEDTRLRSLTRLVVPRIADWCAIDRFDETNSLIRVSRGTAQLRQSEPDADLLGHHAVKLLQVLRTGQAGFWPELSAATVDAPIIDQRHELRSEATIRSLLIVPLVGRERTLGAITLALADSEQRYDADDLALAVDLARRAALALDNARLYREVREQREWLYGALSSIGDAVIATDMAGVVTFINPVAARLTGWSEAEAHGQPLQAVFKIVDERTRETAEDPVARVLREGAAVGLANHTLLIRRDGVAIPIDDSGAPIFNANRQIVGVVLVFRDV